MKHAQYLANRLKEVLTEGKWVTGTNYKEQILSVDWKTAVASFNHLNSIAQLTAHIHYYIKGVTQVLKGGKLEISDKHSFNSKPIQSEQEWKELTTNFCNDAKIFIGLVENLTDEQLNQYFDNEKYGTYHRNIDLMIEHCYYHLGQLLIIKKLISKKITQ